MHAALIPADQVDDFIILKARAFTSKIRRAMLRDVLQDQDLQLIEWQLLFNVARFGTCHLAFITQHSSMDPAHGSRAATSLEKKALIERHDDPENRRRKLISLTPKGIAKVEEIWPRARDVIKAVTNPLESKEISEIKRLLDLLNAQADQLETAN